MACRMLMRLFLCGCVLLPVTGEDEEMVTIPRQWLGLLQVPLHDGNGQPSAYLIRLLELDGAEIQGLAAVLHAHRQAIIDYIVEQAVFDTVEADKMVVDLPAPGESLAIVTAGIDEAVQELLGDRYPLLAALRHPASARGGRIVVHERHDRLLAGLTNPIRLDANWGLRIDLRRGEDGTWDRRYGRLDGEGNQRGTNRQHGPSLVGMEALLYEGLLARARAEGLIAFPPAAEEF